jgi:hypothetical protein
MIDNEVDLTKKVVPRISSKEQKIIQAERT